MRGIKKLHHLIQALSKTEKRYISIELTKQRSKKGHIDLTLFNILKNQNTIDEEKIRSRSEFNSTIKLIIRSKYLFDFILRCLIDYNHSRETEIAIGNHIRTIKIFILKGLHEYAFQHLTVAEKLAEKYEDLYRQGILCTLRKTVVNRSSSSYTNFLREVQKIEDRENAVHEKVINLDAYNKHLDHLSVVLKKNAGIRPDKETQQVIKDIATSPHFTSEKNALTKKAKLVFYEVNSILQELAHRDYKKALLYTEKQITLIRKMESHEKKPSLTYIHCLRNYCIFSSEAEQFAKAKEALEELKKLYEGKSVAHNHFEKSLVFLNYFEAETRLTVIDRQFSRFGNESSNTAEEAEQYEKIYDGESRLIIYFNLALRLLLTNDYKNAFRWLEKILHEHHGMRLDILEDAHVLSLVCIFEIDSVNLFQSRERSYLRHYHFSKANTEQKTAHSRIIQLLGKVYQHKSDAENVKKSLKELESYVTDERKKNGLDTLLGETILIWIRKKRKK